MIPFALFTTTILDSGIVRVDFNNINWVQSGDVYTYVIPRTIHRSGLYPKTHIVNKTGNILTGVNVQYNNYAVMLEAVTPIPSFTAYFMGDEREQVPAGVLPPRTLFATNNTLHCFYNNEWYEAPVPTAGSTLSWTKNNSINLPIETITDATFNQLRRIVVTASGQVYTNRNQTTLARETFFDSLSAKVIRVGATGRTNINPTGNIMYLALLDNGDIYANGSFAIGNPVISTGGLWVKLVVPEPCDELSADNLYIIARGVSGKIYGNADYRNFPGMSNTPPYQLNESTNNSLSISARDADIIGYCSSFVDDNTNLLYIAGANRGSSSTAWYDTGITNDGMIYSVSSSFIDIPTNAISGWLTSTNNELYKMVDSGTIPVITKTPDVCSCIAAGAWGDSGSCTAYGIFGILQDNSGIVYHTPTTRAVYNLPV